MDQRQSHRHSSGDHRSSSKGQQYVGTKRSHNRIEARESAGQKMSFESGLESLGVANPHSKSVSPNNTEQKPQETSNKRYKVSSFSPGESTTNQNSTPIRAGNRTSHTSQDSVHKSDEAESSEEEEKRPRLRVDPADATEVIDFSHYTRHMLKLAPTDGIEPIFKSHKQGNIQISKLALNTNKTVHIQRNKLSDKLGRRDVQFYDLYKLQQPQEDVNLLQDRSFKLAGVIPENDPIYGDIECSDFNQIFLSDSIVNEQFGQSLTVKLTLEDKTVRRKVTEDESKCKKLTPEQLKIRARNSSGQANTAEPVTFEDKIAWETVKTQLTNLMREFKQSQEQIAELYTSMSGEINDVRSYLEGKKVQKWNRLEDLALACPEDSPEFSVLLQTKGWKAIYKRRSWLEATPITEVVTQVIGEDNEEVVKPTTEAEQ